MVKWLPPLLPSAHGRIRGAHQLKEDERPARAQDTADAADSVYHARNRAQRESAHDSVHAPLLQGDALSWKVQEFNSHPRPSSLAFSESPHRRVGFERVERAHFARIIVQEIRAGTCSISRTSPCANGMIFRRTAWIGCGSPSKLTM